MGLSSSRPQHTSHPAIAAISHCNKIANTPNLANRQFGKLASSSAACHPGHQSLNTRTACLDQVMQFFRAAHVHVRNKHRVLQYPV